MPLRLPVSTLLGWVHRRASWLLLSAVLLSLVAWLTVGHQLARMDRALLEGALNRVRPAAASNIVIVAIDDKSLEAVGRWPWRRALHAELLRRISLGRPRCIGLDLLLDDTNTQHPEDDALLAASMQAAGCVVLPMAMQVSGRNLQLQSEVLPVPRLARAATALGHSHLAVNDDGGVQGIYLREGFPGREWPQFSMALRDAAAGRLKPQPSLQDGPATSPPEGRWQREHLEMLLYTTPSAPFQTVSYIDVLRGEVPPGFFQDRYVLIGATADGVADLFASPAPSRQGLVTGVEVFATVLQALDVHRHIHPASLWQDLAFNLVPLAIVLLSLLWLGPLGAFALTVGMVLVRCGLQISQPWLGVRFTNAAGLGGLLAVYPIWSLMRLMSAYRFLRLGTRELDAVLEGMGTLNIQATPQGGDSLEREIDATATAVRRVRDMHRFVRDGLDHLPDANLVLDRRGRVYLANRAAVRHWLRPAAQLVGEDAHALLSDLRPRSGGSQPMVPPGTLDAAHPMPIMGEGEDSAGRIVLLRCVPFQDADNSHAGWMVALVDITRMRRTQGQRDEALRFISHDIREPSASILTALALARANPALLPHERLVERIERHARTGLELADDFVNLARAEAQPFRAELLDLVDLLAQATDNAWAEAHRRQLRVRVSTELEEAPCIGDRSLLARALTNVLNNALKYSPGGSEVLCEVADRQSHWRLSIRDQGPGIPIEQQTQLFRPFQRLHGESHPDVPGIGLGLLLVSTTLQRHGGTVEIESARGSGCTVILVLPKPTAAALQSIAHANSLEEP